MKRDAFMEFVLDQLGAVEPVECRPMSGGYGLYHNGVFFGIILRGQLFFKTSDKTRADYVRRGMEPFRPNARQTLWSYYEVPAEILEDAGQLAAWARRAIAA